MSSIGLTYHAGQRVLERKNYISFRKVKDLLKQRRAYIVPAREGRIGVFIPERYLIVIISVDNSKIVSVMYPSAFYKKLIKKAEAILQNPFRIKPQKNNIVLFYSEDGHCVHTTKSGKTILKIKLPLNKSREA